MRNVTLLLLMLSLAAAGCFLRKAEPPPQGIVAEQTEDGLKVELRVPQRDLVRGQTVPVTVIASNLTGKEIVVPASSGALVYVSIWRSTATGWEQVKRYPETAAELASPWRLAGKSSHTFPVNLPVAPDWPTGEPLRITAELNGRPGIAPGGIIEVFLTEIQRDRAAVD